MIGFLLRRLGNATTTAVPQDADDGYDEFIADEHFTEAVTYVPAAIVVDEECTTVPAVPDETMREILYLRAKRDRLSRTLEDARAATRREKLRADAAEQALRELRIANATPAATELARARRTLTLQDDLLAGCRQNHGSNISAHTARTGTADTDATYDEIAAIKRQEDV